jgi:hypothetical protein
LPQGQDEWRRGQLGLGKAKDREQAMAAYDPSAHGLGQRTFF